MEWITFFLVAQVALIAYAIGRLGAYWDGYEHGHIDGWNALAKEWLAHEQKRRAELQEQWQRLYGKPFDAPAAETNGEQNA